MVGRLQQQHYEEGLIRQSDVFSILNDVGDNLLYIIGDLKSNVGDIINDHANNFVNNM